MQEVRPGDQKREATEGAATVLCHISLLPYHQNTYQALEFKHQTQIET